MLSTMSYFRIISPVCIAVAVLCTCVYAKEDVDAEDNGPVFPPAVQRVVDKIHQHDKAMIPTAVAYKRTGAKGLERKLERLDEKRKKLRADLAAAVTKAKTPLKKKIDRISMKFDATMERAEKVNPRNTRQVERLDKEMAEIKGELFVERDLFTALSMIDEELEFLQLPRQDEAGAVEREGLTVKLPTVEKGKWQGSHAVYQAESFVATMDETGELLIRIKDPDDPEKFLPPGIVFGRPVMFSPIAIIGFSEFAAEPVKQPKQLKLRGFFNGNVEFVVEYTFAGNQITVAGGFRHPTVLVSKAVSFRLETRIAASEEVSAPDPKARDSKTGPLLTTKEKVGTKSKTFKYRFHTWPTFTGRLQAARVTGLWKERVVKFRQRKMDTSFACIVDQPLWQGVTIYYVAGDDELDHKGRKYSISID